MENAEVHTGSLLPKYATDAARRRCAALYSLRSVFTSDHLRPFFVVARGSLARGDYCAHSDIDLTVVTDDPKCAAYAESSLHKIDEELIGRLAIDVLTPSDVRKRLRWITYWFGVVESIFVGGNSEVYFRYKSEQTDLLKSMSIGTLVDIYRSDPRRYDAHFDAASPFRWNIKRGAGGFVDFEFANLLSHWTDAKQRSSTAYGEHYRQINAAYEYLFAMKAYLHDCFGAAREVAVSPSEELADRAVPAVFSRTVAEKVLDDHYERIERLVRSFGGKCIGYPKAAG